MCGLQKRRSFLGITVHWIESDLKRGSAALACKRFKGTHDFKNIAENLENTYLKYGITDTKIVATVTDNGSNFVKAFKQFGITEDKIIVRTASPEYEIDSENEESEQDIEHHAIVPDCEEGGNETILPDAEIVANKNFVLSKHVRCASHTLNLIATTDCQKAISSNIALRTRHTHTLHKCSQLWKKANTPKSAEIIQEILGHTLSYPGPTRWNSFFDAITQILNEKNKLTHLLQRLELNCFKETEILYLEEYLKVLKPLAVTLDFLQGQNNTYYGYLLPSIISLRNKFNKLKTEKFKYGGDIILAASIKGLERRFSDLLQLNSKNAIISSVLCPNFKLRWFSSVKDQSNINIDAIKKLIITAGYDEFHCDNTNPPNEDSSEEDLNLNMLFDFNEPQEERINTVSYLPTNFGNQCNIKTELELLTYLDDNRKNLIMLDDYPRLKKLFVKYNTCLPSSAPVERLFSYATIVNAPRRNALSDENFEKLVFLKANLQI